MTEYHEGDRIEWAELDLSDTKHGLEWVGSTDDGAPVCGGYLNGKAVTFKVAVLEVTEAVDGAEIYGDA